MWGLKLTIDWVSDLSDCSLWLDYPDFVYCNAGSDLWTPGVNLYLPLEMGHDRVDVV